MKLPRSPQSFNALRTWRRELTAGHRTPTTFDATWRAACEELTAPTTGGGRATPRRDELLDAIEAGICATLDRCETHLLALEARAALTDGHRSRAWWLRARAAAIAGAP